MILLAWSWRTNIIYSEVNNKIFSVQSCWFLSYILEMPVTESPTAIAVQDYTQLNDLGLNYYIFMVIMLTKLYNCTWFNFILEFCSLMLHFIFHIFSLYCCCCCCFIGKSKIDKLLLPKVVHLMVNNCEIKELGTI